VITARHLGLDLGGTNIKVAVLEQDDDASLPRLVEHATVPTHAERGPDGVAAALVDAGRAAIAGYGPIATVGVGIPGLFDHATGRVTLFPNLPGPWAGYPLRDKVADGIGMAVTTINDARAHTLAEARMGAGRGASTMAMLTLGTGIGGGIMIHGRLHLGTRGTAGEIGHQTVHEGGRLCGCGNRGCAEPYAQAGALMRTAGRDSVEAVFAGAAAGDPACQTAIAEAVEALGIAIGNVVTVLVPDRVVIGGGISEAGEAIMAPLRASVARHSPFVPAGPELVLAELGPAAGAIGAALAGAEADGSSATRRE
jgi:glucokinase